MQYASITDLNDALDRNQRRLHDIDYGRAPVTSEATWTAMSGALDDARSAVNPTLTLDGPPDIGRGVAPPVGRRARRRAARTPVETPDFAAMMRRMLLAHGRRVADADVEDLAELIELHATLDEAIAFAIRESRQRWDRSWSDIARAAGITRQAAQQKWGER